MATSTRRSAPTARTGTAAAILAVVSWGLGNVLVKHIHLTGVSLAFNRLCLGAVVFTVALLLTGGHLTWRTLRVAAPGGVAFAIDVTLFFTAVKHTSVADASIITALQPALVFVVAGRLFGEHVTRRIVGWTALAVVGVGIAVVGSAAGAGRTLEGDLIAGASLVAWAWYFVASKQARQQLKALEYQAGLTIVAAMVVTPFALATSHDLVVHDWSTAGWVVVMVVVPGGGHLMMNWAHQYAPITLTSMITLGIPVVGTIGAALLLGEQVTLVQSLGMAVVLVALALILRRPPLAEAPLEILVDPPA
jgi:drug/metabolite transporter (DMT)-like permease